MGGVVHNSSPLGSGKDEKGCFITLYKNDWSNWRKLTQALRQEEVDDFVKIGLAHELGHCVIHLNEPLMQSRYPFIYSVRDKARRDEVLADVFALDWARENIADWKEKTAKWVQFREKSETVFESEYQISSHLKSYLVLRETRLLQGVEKVQN